MLFFTSKTYFIIFYKLHKMNTQKKIKKVNKRFALLCAIFVCVINKPMQAEAQNVKMVGPHVIVYKTKKDYNNLVPIILSADKKSIVSYPDPHDIKVKGENILPTKLHKNYLLDNRGISKNVAFLKMNYTEYANLPQVPTQAELMSMLIDTDPLISICDCGLKSEFKDPIKELNRLIRKNKLSDKCK